MAATRSVAGRSVLRTEDVAVEELSGWPLDPRERGDFLHRTRTFPEAVAQWRSRIVDSLLSEGRGKEELREELDEVISSCRELTRTLAATYSVRSGDEFASDAERWRNGPRAVLDRIAPWTVHRAPEGLPPTAAAVPPNLRPALHALLTVHRTETCHEKQPNCGGCSIRNLCASYRDQQSVAYEGSGGPTTIDLFCGAGGSSEGFSRAGYRVLAALDRDPVALKTYRLNHPQLRKDRVINADIQALEKGHLRRIVGRRRLDVLIGSPPCQGFSHAGFRSKKTMTGYKLSEDARNYLYEDMLDIALDLRPRLLLLENVPGMQSAKRDSVSFIESAAKLLEKKGEYSTAIWKLNASAFGVAQDRIRYFLVAAARGQVLPARPPEEYKDIHRPDYDIDGLPPVTLDEAIFDLPERAAGSGTAVARWLDREAGAPKFRRYLAKFRLLRETPVIYNHHVRYHNERDLELYALLRPGEDSIHAVERYGRDDLMRYRRDVFDDKYARLRGDRPSKTIVSHLAKDGNGYIHPRQVRSISVREAARAQSFHDEYVFCGSPSDQWIQVGNAVPPVLAEAIARSFARALKKGEVR
jgi:DNA (cytosine-5)-methyltransferase 1